LQGRRCRSPVRVGRRQSSTKTGQGRGARAGSPAGGGVCCVLVSETVPAGGRAPVVGRGRRDTGLPPGCHAHAAVYCNKKHPKKETRAQLDVSAPSSSNAFVSGLSRLSLDHHHHCAAVWWRCRRCWPISPVPGKSFHAEISARVGDLYNGRRSLDHRIGGRRAASSPADQRRWTKTTCFTWRRPTRTTARMPADGARFDSNVPPESRNIDDARFNVSQSHRPGRSPIWVCRPTGQPFGLTIAQAPPNRLFVPIPDRGRMISRRRTTLRKRACFLRPNDANPNQHQSTRSKTSLCPPRCRPDVFRISFCAGRLTRMRIWVKPEIAPRH